MLSWFSILESQASSMLPLSISALSRYSRRRWLLVLRVAYSTMVPVLIMNAQSLACASSSSRAAWFSARDVTASGREWLRPSFSIDSAAACRWR